MNAFTDRRTMLRGLGVLTAGAAASAAAIPAIAARSVGVSRRMGRRQ
jgi:hypothetical protein